jgi:PAS domain S-box-containing protein
MSITADTKLALTELLLSSDDLAHCAQGALDWLSAEVGPRRAVCAAVVGGGDPHLWGVACTGVSAARTGEFAIDPAGREDPLSAAVRSGRHVWFGLAPRPVTPLDDCPFHAMPLRPDRRGPTLGLLLVEGGQPRPDRSLQWLARVLGMKLLRISSGSGGHDASLDRERQLLFAVINAVSDPILLTDVRGNLLVGNSRAEQLLAWTAETSEGRRHALELNNLYFSAALASSAVDHGTGSREVALVDPDDGSELLFELMSTPLEIQRGESAFVSVLRNVTDLGRAAMELEENYRRLHATEAQARAERRRMEQVIDSVVDPIVVARSSAEILMTNKPAEFLFTAAEHDQHGLRRARANVAQFTSFVAGLLMSGSADRVRERLSLADPVDNRQIPVEAVAVVVPSGGAEPPAVVTVLHDLTETLERERLYAELQEGTAQLEHRVREATAELANQNELLRRQAIALADASAAKSRFLASVSHEFRTPLNAVLGYTWMLLQDGSSVDAANARRMIAKIDSNSRHLASLINDVLDISRIEADHMPIDVAPFSVEPLVREVLDELEPVTAASPVPVRCAVPRGLPSLRSDRQKVKQILVNLLSNAVKFTREGQIRILAAVDVGSGRWRIVVRDTGIGVAPADCERIFDAFEQAGSPGSHPGTGLGLAISRRLARLLGGDVELRSTPGRGSTFTLALPPSPPARARRRRAASARSDAVATALSSGASS